MKAYGGKEVCLHSFLTSALEEANGQPHAPAALPIIFTEQKAGYASIMVWIFWKREKSVVPRQKEINCKGLSCQI
jgi:hypothetical protein